MVTPFVGVWIETYENEKAKGLFMSHPSWVCGLKHYAVSTDYVDKLSHPSWVCGLKLLKEGTENADSVSHPSWVCGLKHWTC